MDDLELTPLPPTLVYVVCREPSQLDLMPAKQAPHHGLFKVNESPFSIPPVGANSAVLTASPSCYKE